MLLIFSGFGMSLFFIGNLMLAATGSNFGLYFGAYFVVFSGLNMTSLGHILVFKTKYTSSSSSEKRSGNSLTTPPHSIDKPTTEEVTVNSFTVEYV